MAWRRAPSKAAHSLKCRCGTVRMPGLNSAEDVLDDRLTTNFPQHIEK